MYPSKNLTIESILGSDTKSCFVSIVILKNTADIISNNIIKTSMVDISAAIPPGSFNFRFRKIVNDLVINAINNANTNGPVYESVEKNNTNNTVYTTIKIKKPQSALS
jgi:hypothetical protein